MVEIAELCEPTSFRQVLIFARQQRQFLKGCLCNHSESTFVTGETTAMRVTTKRPAVLYVPKVGGIDFIVYVSSNCLQTPKLICAGHQSLLLRRRLTIGMGLVEMIRSSYQTAVSGWS